MLFWLDIFEPLLGHPMEKNGVDTVLCVFKSKGAIWFCFCRFNCLSRSYTVQDFLLSSRVPCFWKPKQKVSESCFQGRYTISELIFIMPGNYCCVAWCDNNDVRDSKKLSFHMFPKGKAIVCRHKLTKICRPLKVPMPLQIWHLHWLYLIISQIKNWLGCFSLNAKD